MEFTLQFLSLSLLGALVVMTWGLIFIGIDHGILNGQLSKYLNNRFDKFVNRQE